MSDLSLLLLEMNLVFAVMDLLTHQHHRHQHQQLPQVDPVVTVFSPLLSMEEFMIDAPQLMEIHHGAPNPMSGLVNGNTVLIHHVQARIKLG